MNTSDFALSWQLAELSGFSVNTADDTTVVLVHKTGGKPIRIRKSDLNLFYANAREMDLNEEEFATSSEEALALYEKNAAESEAASSAFIPANWSGEFQSFGL